jgi:hypothetical protein
METIVDHFDQLTECGINVIPLWENSKQPMCKGWSRTWNREHSRRVLQVYPSANIGILLGGIVDVEGDSENANRTIWRLVKGHPHPSYKSQRSIHHLFINPDPNLRIFRYNEVEFRGYGHQSVLPPSQHQGTQYLWLDTTFPIPPMPPKLLEFYYDLKSSHSRIRHIKPQHHKIWCHQCGVSVILHEKRMQLEQEAFRLLGMSWECRKCRELDLRSICRHLKSGKNVPKTLQ